LKIIWSPEAADDFESAVTYLVGVNPAAARRLVASVLGLIEWLAVEPVLGPSHVLKNGDVVHGWPLKPFRVYYQRDSASFRVVRIYHQRREPITR